MQDPVSKIDRHRGLSIIRHQISKRSLVYFNQRVRYGAWKSIQAAERSALGHKSWINNVAEVWNRLCRRYCIKLAWRHSQCERLLLRCGWIRAICLDFQQKLVIAWILRVIRLHDNLAVLDLNEWVARAILSISDHPDEALATRSRYFRYWGQRDGHDVKRLGYLIDQCIILQLSSLDAR